MSAIFIFCKSGKCGSSVVSYEDCLKYRLTLQFLLVIILNGVGHIAVHFEEEVEFDEEEEGERGPLRFYQVRLSILLVCHHALVKSLDHKGDQEVNKINPVGAG